MLRKFRVSNFKSFKEDFEIDLTQVKGYGFNPECIKNNIVNTSIIYGYNGVGKSNLALAIFDIIEHLTDKNKSPDSYENYLNIGSESNHATFYFEFLINKKIVTYEYKKTDYETIIYERFCINDTELVLLDRQKTTKAIIKFEGTETLNNIITNNQLSVLKYIKNNSVLIDNETNKIFNDFFAFIESMLFFRSLDDRMYLGFKEGSKSIIEDIIEKGNVDDFEQFLNDANVKCKLKVIDDLIGKKTFAFVIGNKFLDFIEAASTGTKSLVLFYYWYQCIKNEGVPFLFIDEFDAFYHHELSALIVKKLIESGVQCILTSHNVSIITNDLLRPDCYFLMNKSKAGSLANCTQKELREAHNIEKMYKAGTFNV